MKHIQTNVPGTQVAWLVLTSFRIVITFHIVIFNYTSVDKSNARDFLHYATNRPFHAVYDYCFLCKPDTTHRPGYHVNMSEHSGKESDSVHCCDQLLPLHAHQPLGAGTLWGFCIHLCMSTLMHHLLTTTTLHTTAIFCCCVCWNMPESSPKCSRCMYSVRLCQYQFLEPYPGNDDESSGFYCPQAHNLVNIKQNER